MGAMRQHPRVGFMEKGVNELHYWENGIDKFPIVTQRFIIDVGPLQLKTSWSLSACLGSVWIGVDKGESGKKHGEGQSSLGSQY